ncbi:MAG: DUF4249 family protein [Bacteroidota bacterium]
MKYLIPLALSVALFLLAFSCEDPIDVPSQFEEPSLVIDAWLTNTNTPQTITLTETVDYFAGGQPRGVAGAVITVCKNETDDCFSFTDEGGGSYVWRPIADETLGEVGDNFTLSMNLDGETYTGAADLARTARLDSISITFEEESLFMDEGLYAELFAFDLLGQGDSYLIRTFKNDSLLNRPEETIIVYDATFDRGNDLDGTYFIPPIRSSINPVDDDGLQTPYNNGDRVYVEVHSISEVAYDFLSIAIEQITNTGLFATPVANSPSNVFNTTTNESILGIFNVAEVASIETLVEE